MRWLLWSLCLAMPLVAQQHELDLEQLCRPDGWYDLGAFAGARHTFFSSDEGLRVRRVTYGSGEPIIADETLTVRVAGDTLYYDGARLVFDTSAGVLRVPWHEGDRLVPGGPADWQLAPTMAGLSEQELNAALTSPHPLTRCEALSALADARTRHGVDGFAAALPLLEDPAPAVRARAAWALSACRERAGAAGVRALLADEDAGVRCAAARALGWGAYGGAGSLAPLQALAADPVPEVRAAAAWALGVLRRR